MKSLATPDAKGQIDARRLQISAARHEAEGRLCDRADEACRGKGNEWLLIKKQDEFAVPGYDIDQFAWSVATKRTQDEIAERYEAVAVRNLEGRAQSPHFRPTLNRCSPPPSPSRPPETQWSTKSSGTAFGRCACQGRQAPDPLAARQPMREAISGVARLAEHVNAKTAWLDGEICVLDENGRARFELIQPRIAQRARPSLACAEHARQRCSCSMCCMSMDTTCAACRSRNAGGCCKRLVRPTDQIRISEVFETDGEHMFEAAREMGLEGIWPKIGAAPTNRSGRAAG